MSGKLQVNDNSSREMVALTMPFCRRHENNIILKTKQEIECLTEYLIGFYSIYGHRNFATRENIYFYDHKGINSNKQVFIPFIFCAFF